MTNRQMDKQMENSSSRVASQLKITSKLEQFIVRYMTFVLLKQTLTVEMNLKKKNRF